MANKLAATEYSGHPFDENCHPMDELQAGPIIPLYVAQNLYSHASSAQLVRGPLLCILLQ